MQKTQKQPLFKRKVERKSSCFFTEVKSLDLKTGLLKKTTEKNENGFPFSKKNTEVFSEERERDSVEVVI